MEIDLPSLRERKEDIPDLVAYLLENLPTDRQLHFAVELNFAGLPADGREGKVMLRDSMEDLERRLIREAMEKVQDHQTRAAEILGISKRMLRYKLKKYGLKE